MTNLKHLIFNIIDIITKPYNKAPSSFDNPVLGLDPH